jgi:beta-lactamase class D
MTTFNRRAALAALGNTGLMLATPCALHAQTRRTELRPDLNGIFAEAGAEGTIAILDLKGGRLVVTDLERAETQFLPASTFKIPNSLIALEMGAAADADHPTFKWDGVVRDIDDWNRDHTLRTAIKASVVPVYQEIARQVGPERMQRYVDAFEYGNRDIAGAIDTLWLEGGLRITALQQVAFLEKLFKEELPASKRSMEIVKDIMLLEQNDLGVMRGKTGLLRVDEKMRHGWLAGWVERRDEGFIFAMNLSFREQSVVGRRLAIAKALLKQVIPSQT